MNDRSEVPENSDSDDELLEQELNLELNANGQTEASNEEEEYFDESGQTHDDGTGGITQTTFLALCATQFFTAFNDNMFRWLVVKIAQDILKTKTLPLVLGAIFFTVPYLLFAPMAGYFADRFSKRKIIVACKFAEIVLMSSALIAIQMENIYLLLGLVFLMGTQSALFSPAKMGAIPEMLAFRHLSSGNGVFAMVTIIGTAIGTFAGYQLYGMTYDDGTLVSLSSSAIALIGIALIGFVISLAVITRPAADPNRPFVANPVAEMIPSLRLLFSDRWLARAALGVGFFYFIALLAQVNLDSFGEQVLDLATEDVGSLFIPLVLGIGMGGILAGLWSAGRIQVGMVPVGAFGIAVCSIILAWIANGESSNLIWTNNLAIFWLFGLGTVAGLFYIPLESYLQHSSPPDVRGSILAASNALTNFLMLVAMGFFFVMTDANLLGWTSSAVFVFIAILGLALTIYSFILIPLAFMRFCMWIWCTTFYKIRMHGLENLDQSKGLLFTPNHISWVDGVMLCSMLPKHARFLIYADFTEKNRVLAWLAKKYDVIPVKAGAGPRAIIGALKDAENSLKHGDWVCVFPEGQLSRTGKIQPFQRGAMKIVSKSSAPIVPVYLDGLWGSVFSYRRKFLWRLPDKLRGPVDIWFGDPVSSIENASELQQKVVALGAHAMHEGSKNLLIPIRQFIRQCKKSKFRSKIADTSQADLTGGKLLAGTIALSRVLKREVLTKDESSVGIFLPPSAGGVLANTTLGLLGKTSVNLNYTLSEDVVNYCVKQSEIKHILTSKRFLEKRPFNIEVAELVYLEDLKEKVTGLDRAIAAFQSYLVPTSIIEWMNGLKKIDSESLMTIIFTSGSTGEPKGVMLSHRNIASNIDGVDQLYRLTNDDTIVGVLPFFHSFGYTISLWVVLTSPPKGAYHFNPLDARQVGKLAGKHGGTILLSTPTFLKTYIKRCTEEQFAKMRLIVVGAEKLPADLAANCEEKFGIAPIEGYGATETSPLACANGIDFKDESGFVHQVDNKLGTVGQPINGVVVRSVDPDSYEPLPVGEEGLLMIKGPNIMMGYLKQPEKTEQVIRDGWYDSGDFGKVDEEGFVIITGRKSRFSKIGGEMVPHIRIEEELIRTVEAASVPKEDDEVEILLAVTAVPDEKKGEKLVVLHKKLPCEIDHLRNQLSESGLPNLWIPGKDCFVEIEEIPLLGTGKLDLKGIQLKAVELFS